MVNKYFSYESSENKDTTCIFFIPFTKWKTAFCELKNVCSLLKWV